ncbi:MAG TPA: hypothetical protein VF065_11035, partial [Ilumatobacter sp.]
AGSNVIGYSVETLDGRIGKIDAASDEADAAHLVVDTGFWIFGTKRLIPAGSVTSVDDMARCVHVNLHKQQVRDAPEWGAHSNAGWKDRYNDYYGPLGS